MPQVAHAFRAAKCAPQNAIAAPNISAETPASTPATVGPPGGPEATWPAPASTTTSTPTRNCHIGREISPEAAPLMSEAVTKPPTKAMVAISHHASAAPIGITLG